MSYKPIIFSVLILGIPAPSIAAEAPYQASVVKITDGDSLVVLVGREQIRIRLSEIDCPERKQPWGSRAKQALAAYSFRKMVNVFPVTEDRYGRTVATIFVDGINVNKAMVQDGHCWVYRRYVQDINFYDLENEARAARRGLWSIPETDRVPPWEWRRKKR
ncbi:MAG: thermonuclease family protein [Candidatus Thiodiazotropha sp.]